MPNNDFEIRSSSDVRQQMRRMQAHIFQVIDWYERLGFREQDIANDYDRAPFPQEQATELRANRTELAWGNIAMRNKAFAFVERLERWRARLSRQAVERMEYFRVEPPWQALDQAAAEVREINKRKRAPRQREGLLVANL